MDANELLERIQHPLYVKYQGMVKADGATSFKIQDGYFIYGKTKVRPPVVRGVFDKYRELSLERINILGDLYKLQQKLIYGKNPKAYKDVYDTLLVKYQGVENDIEALKTYYIQVNSNEDDEQSIEDRLDEVITNETKTFDKVAKSLFEDDYLDHSLITTYIQHFRKKLKIMDEIMEHNKSVYIDFYIESLPEFVEKKAKDKLETEIEPESEQKDHKKPHPGLSDDQKEKIVKNIKDLIREKFKFKSSEECVSKARTKPFHMSKEEIIKIIENNPEIKVTMPKNYKQLKKEEICKYLF